MEICMKEILKTIEFKDMVFILMLTDLNIQENGKMIYNMAKVQKLGLMVQNLKEIMMKVEKKDKVLNF